MARVSVLHGRARFVLACGVLSALLVGAGGVAAGPAEAVASTRYVAPSGNNTDNDCTDQANPCQTIQDAVDQAIAGDTISIAPGKYDEGVRLRKSATLLGSGATGSGRSTIDGNGSDPSIFVDGFDTNSPPDVTVENLDVSGNQASDGILVDGGSLTVRASRVSTNQGSGIDVDGPSTAQVTRTTVNGNGQNGVLVDNPNDEAGAHTVTVDRSTVDGNLTGGVVVEEGAGHVSRSTLDRNIGAGMVVSGAGASGSLTRSTVSNTIPFTAGGEPFGGGVLVLSGGGVRVDSSTIYRNTGQGVLSDAGAVTIDNSTISGTDPPAAGATFPAGGIAVVASASPPKAPVPPADPPAALTVIGTTVADNTSISDCSGTVSDGGYNLDSDGSCAWTTAHSISKGDAKLGPLADNTGPTETLLPAKGSDAIDAIRVGSANCTKSAKDQRGVSRPQGRTCDIGAVEARHLVIRPRLTSAHGRLHGWYRAPVTVHFTCTTHGATLTRPCPSAVTRTHNGRGQSVTRTITATDGSTDTVKVRHLNIDRVKPHVRVKGVHDGAVYTGTPPRPRCVCRDALSGLASCHITVHKHGRTTTYRAVATDRAGNKRRVRGSYRTIAG